jgi:predicted nuclease of predicted toxin-antitoxin system
MKLLFDQNLSPRLARRLADLYPDSAHVSEFGLDQAQDVEVWDHARQEDFLIVSKDSDFNELSLLRGFPPKVVWIRRGNCTTQGIEAILRQNYDLVEALEQGAHVGILLLY